jgi:hypothetical protein
VQQGSGSAAPFAVPPARARIHALAAIALHRIAADGESTGAIMHLTGWCAPTALPPFNELAGRSVQGTALPGASRQPKPPLAVVET